MGTVGTRTLVVGTVLVVIGALSVIYVPDIYGLVTRRNAGGVVEVGDAVANYRGAEILNIVVTIVRSSFIAIGSSLIGAGVVIKVLSRYVDDNAAEDRSDSSEQRPI